MQLNEAYAIPGIPELYVHVRAHWRWSPYNDNNLSSGNALSYNLNKITHQQHKNVNVKIQITHSHSWLLFVATTLCYPSPAEEIKISETINMQVSSYEKMWFNKVHKQVTPVIYTISLIFILSGTNNGVYIW